MRRINQLDSTKEQSKCVCQCLSELTGIESSQFETAFDYFTSKVRETVSYIPTSTMKGNILLIRTEINMYPLTESYDLEEVRKV